MCVSPSDVPLLPPRGIWVYFHLLLHTFSFLYRHLIARYHIAVSALHHYKTACLFFYNLINTRWDSSMLMAYLLFAHFHCYACHIKLRRGTFTHSPADGHLRGFKVFLLLSMVPWTHLLEISHPDQDLPHAVVLLGWNVLSLHSSPFSSHSSGLCLHASSSEKCPFPAAS